MIADRIAALFRPRSQGSTRPIDPAQLANLIPMLPFNFAGVRLTVDDALQLSVVWACIDAIAKAVSSCRWNIYQSESEERRKRLPNDPLDYLLNVRPNPEVSAIGFREALLFNALSWGNGYAEIVRDGAGNPVELLPLTADRVTPKRDAAGALVYEVAQPNGGTVALKPANVFHVHGPGITGLMGENVVARAAKSIALAAAAERFSCSYFGNNTVIGGVLEYPKTLDDATYNRLKASWEEKHTGPANAHKPLILEGGMKWTPLGVEPEKSQLIESRKFQIEEICRWYGVPPHKVQHLERSTFNNIEHLGIEFVRDALTPWALRLEQEADYKLFPPRAGRFSKLDTAWLSYGDAKSRGEYYQIMRRIGVFSANDILTMEGRNTIGPEGDVRLVESAMTPLDRIGAEQPANDNAGNAANEPNASPIVEDAIGAMIESTLERYARRIENRAADLQRAALPPERIAANLEDERKRTQPVLIADCRRGALAIARRAFPGCVVNDAALIQAAEAVEAGVSPRDAAGIVIAALKGNR